MSASLVMRGGGPFRRLVAAGATAVLLAGTGAALSWSDGPAGAAAATTRLSASGGPAAGVLLPGGVVTGSLLITNPGATAMDVRSVVFAPASSDQVACRTTGVAFAPTVQASLQVPAGGTVVLGWTAFMDLTSDDACQGSVLTSAVTLDGRRAGTAVVRAGHLEGRGAPFGELTTRTRAAVRWPAVPAATGYLLERSGPQAGSWVPACGTSADSPVTALSCTDTGLTKGTAYAYRVTALAGRWRALSGVSGPVVTQTRPSA